MDPAEWAANHPPMLDHRRFTGPSDRHVAVVDIGSNSVRLVVYDQLSRAPYPRFNEKALCRLGAGRGPDGSLAAGAIDHAVRTVGRFFAISRAMDVTRIDILATEAVRRAPNGGDLLAGIRTRCAADVRLLDGAEEARFSALGVVAGFHRPRGLMGDIGGGSLEIIEVRDDAVGDRPVSMGLGALPVTDMLVGGVGNAKRQVDEILTENVPPLSNDPVFYAVGGGWRALARVAIARRGAACRVVHGFEMSVREARDLAKEIARADPETVAALPDVPSRRIDTLPAAALVLDRVLKLLTPERVVFSALGLREGWLHGLLSADERRLDPLLEGAQAFGTRRARVPAFAAALARWTDRLFPAESAADRRLRRAACALSDIAWSHHAGLRAPEIFRQVLQLPLVGINHPERAFLAASLHARHSGRPDDRLIVSVRDLLPPGRVRHAQVLGRALQLGYRLSGSVPDLLDQARLEVGAGTVRVDIGAIDKVPDSDAVRARLAQLAKALDVETVELRSG